MKTESAPASFSTACRSPQATPGKCISVGAVRSVTYTDEGTPLAPQDYGYDIEDYDQNDEDEDEDESDSE